MIQKKESSENKDTKNKSWILYAFGSAIFASLTAILGKIGITGIESNLGTAIRTFVVLVMAWIMVAVTGKMGTVKSIPRKEMLLICLSGIATGTSWLCYYKALQDGLACVVVLIDKLSILVTIVFSYVVFKEKLTTKAGIGLVLIVAGTLAMLL
nr:EamA family transporter [uncultured Treponema sp.]